MRLLMDKGDAMLCEEYTYPHIAESMVQPQGYAAIPLAMDGARNHPGRLQDAPAEPQRCWAAPAQASLHHPSGPEPHR